tara:strand:- start:5702 stop:6943 length:1242 start_codon:yes stop_codon:yes gene_type:complete
MKNANPFFSKKFIDIWLKHFENNNKPTVFSNIESIKFVQNKQKLFYYNVGKNITNGISYVLRNDADDSRGKVFLIYDVLPYLNQQNSISNHPYLILKKVPQYSGYLTDLSGYEDFDSFFSQHFSAKSRSNIRKWDKRLKENFKITFKVFYGLIDITEYNHLFDSLLTLIQKRWSDLGMENDILKDHVYYRELCYNMILDKTASLNVIYSNNEAIAISVCFASKKELFFAITTFDVDFRKYNLGHLLIMYIMKWCFKNGIEIFDYSKGTYEYKTRWSNSTYIFEHHVLFDQKSVTSTLIGNYLVVFYKMKQFLREKNINLLYSKIKYGINNTLKSHAKKEQSIEIKDINPSDIDKVSSKFPLDSSSEDYSRLKPIIYDIIFSNPQPFNSIKVYKASDENIFFVAGEKFLKKVIL